MTTTVAQRSRAKGSRKPPNSVCVTRPGPWGNWWVVVPDDSGERNCWWVHDERYPVTVKLYSDKAAAYAAAVAGFRNDLLHAAADPRAQWIRDHVHELAGKTLLCWCDGPPCHAHVLAELADRGVS